MKKMNKIEFIFKKKVQQIKKEIKKPELKNYRY